MLVNYKVVFAVKYSLCRLLDDFSKEIKITIILNKQNETHCAIQGISSNLVFINFVLVHKQP